MHMEEGNCTTSTEYHLSLIVDFRRNLHIVKGIIIKPFPLCLQVKNWICMFSLCVARGARLEEEAGRGIRRHFLS